MRLIALPPGGALLSHQLIAGSSVVLWSFSSRLIPLLLALDAWRHLVRRVPLRYELGWWNIVFPVGMYAVATHELGRATGTGWMTATGRWEIWIAAAVWAVVFAAMVGRLAAAPLSGRAGTRRRSGAGAPR